jgi:CPA2 family monovalent cation:H+ antiporter-2
MHDVPLITTITVGWLVVEDLFTVIVLVLIPALGDAGAGTSLAKSLMLALLKLGALVALLLFAGSRVVPCMMVRVARLRSRELFTLTILVMAVTVAAASQYLFGASMALGAFLAGMVVGQSSVSHQAAADVLPLRDAFAVLFFTSVGMLFDPRFILHQPLLVVSCLGIVIIGKPLVAMLIVAIIGYPARTGIIVALGLAQISEFSFILSELGRQHGLLSDAAHNVLVACALVSITLNPILMCNLDRVEQALTSLPKLWRFINRATVRRQRELNATVITSLEKSDQPLAVILGYGPVGQTADTIIRKSGLETLVVDLNKDTVQSLARRSRLAIYGDAYNVEVMAQALARATHLVPTLPHSSNRNPVIATAKRGRTGAAGARGSRRRCGDDSPGDDPHSAGVFRRHRHERTLMSLMPPIRWLAPPSTVPRPPCPAAVPPTQSRARSARARVPSGHTQAGSNRRPRSAAARCGAPRRR